jgi:hypothetical protein
VAVHPIKRSSFYYNPSLTSIQAVKDYYGAKIIETNELGQIDILVAHSDGTTSCDGPRETYDNIFESVVLFYECAAGELKYQEFSKTNGLFVAGSINKVDSVFIGSDCLK